MKLRVIAIVITALLLSGCHPKSAMLKQRDLQRIDVGLGVDGPSKILPSDEEVDLLSREAVNLLQGHGFELLNSSVSWGLQPLTGHTQNLGLRLPGTNAIYCYVKISKKEFQAEFVEMEKQPQTNKFATSNSDLMVVDKAVAALNELAKLKFKGRSTRISKFDRAESPNK
ncbi:MAG: hypothetical protein KZQ75_10195 [Candidatus Thiodiazotropha sp. (ex Myrtea spinifera)]|nr:hypothetical protein [Candidatus Thiodiazotropha sp. (ex Myrtea spinifera)]